MPAQPSAELLAALAKYSGQPVATGFMPWINALREHYGESLSAIVLYGSCLQKQDPTDGLADFYVLVDDYEQLYPKRWLSLANQWLPPNVFYHETETRAGRLRAKVAVLSTQAFLTGNRDAFHSYFWARFAQPCRILYTRDQTSLDHCHQALAFAVLKFLTETLPALPDRAMTAAELWQHGLALTYAAELRAERGERVQQLTDSNQAYYQDVTALAAPCLPEQLSHENDLYRAKQPDRHRWLPGFKWRIRRWQGLLLSILRLAKAVFTFAGGVDYIAWKIERHTGEKVVVTEKLRNYPIVFGLITLWRLKRRGLVN